MIQDSSQNPNVHSFEGRVSVKKLTCKHQLKVVSLFSGCGGLDLGFLGGFSVYAEDNKKTFVKNPYKIIWANDCYKEACETYKNNIGDHIICGDINNIDKAAIPQADIIIGGFPCQDFSISGKKLAFQADRGNLYKHMVELVGMQKPLAFLAENVKHIVNDRMVDLTTNRKIIDIIRDDFTEKGYNVSVNTIYAPDYGVPQKRERVFIVGIRNDLQCHFCLPKSHHLLMDASQAIDDLWGKENDLTIANHNQVSIAKFPERRSSGNQGNYRIDADEPSQVIRAEHHGNIQGHYRTFNSDDPFDRKAWRRLTVRECARLQTFPDDFKFYGSMTECYKIVGNAVPPILGWYMARALYIACMTEEKTNRHENFPS